MRIKICKCLMYFITVLLLTLGCSQHPANFRLPTGWPIPELVPPPGSSAAKYQVDLNGKSEYSQHVVQKMKNSNATLEAWALGYTNLNDWTSNIASIEAVLIPMGYTITRDAPNERRYYQSSDKHMIVGLAYQKITKIYILEVRKSSSAIDKS